MAVPYKVLTIPAASRRVALEAMLGYKLDIIFRDGVHGVFRGAKFAFQAGAQLTQNRRFAIIPSVQGESIVWQNRS